MKKRFRILFTACLLVCVLLFALFPAAEMGAADPGSVWLLPYYKYSLSGGLDKVNYFVGTGARGCAVGDVTFCDGYSFSSLAYNGTTIWLFLLITAQRRLMST